MIIWATVWGYEPKYLDENLVQGDLVQGFRKEDFDNFEVRKWGYNDGIV